MECIYSVAEWTDISIRWMRYSTGDYYGPAEQKDKEWFIIIPRRLCKFNSKI